MATLTVLMSLSMLSAQAAESASSTVKGNEAEARTLSPTQLTAIRAVGRNVLVAKKSGSDDPADAEQLARLRGTLDALIAVDQDPNNRIPITAQGRESNQQRMKREHIAALRESARADARALATQLRQRGEIKAARAQTTPDKDTHSAGLPIGAQRARLFERWSAKLDAALIQDSAERLAQLRELRDQLRPAQSSISEPRIVPDTPTLQAMPAGYVPPMLNDVTATN
jgi:hypothetical protein